MLNQLLLTLVILLGTKEPLVLYPYTDYTPILVWNLAVHPEEAKPDIAIKVGDKCPICNGQGWLGDGTIKNPCSHCKADGRVDTGDPILAGESSNEPTSLGNNDRVTSSVSSEPDIPLSTQTEVVDDSDTYATPQETVDRILAYLQPKPNEIFLDLGSGDGRVAITAAKTYGCNAIGIEKDPNRITLATKNTEKAGVSDKVHFIEGDFTTTEWPYADVGYVYLFPEDLALIKDKLLSLDRFASFSHQVPSLPMYQKDDFFYWDSDKVFTWYNGRTYTGRHCSKAGCSMCATIQRGLDAQKSPRKLALSTASQTPTEWEKKDPPLSVPLSSPEKTWSFSYQGSIYYYQSDIDKFVSTSGKKYQVNLTKDEWIKEGSINICTYDSQGNETSCTNCKLYQVIAPTRLLR